MDELNEYYDQQDAARKRADRETCTKLLGRIQELFPQVVSQLRAIRPPTDHRLRFADGTVQWAWPIGQYHTSVDNYVTVYITAVDTGSRLALAGSGSYGVPADVQLVVDLGRSDLRMDLLQSILKGLEKTIQRHGLPSARKPRRRR